MGQKNMRLILSACTVNLIGFAIGNAYGWSSVALMSLKSDDKDINPIGRPVTLSEESWIASIINLGALFGPLLSGLLSSKFGRKITLLTFSVPMLVAQVIMAFATLPVEFYVARFISGMGVGCGYTVIPMYIGEIAETKIRGVLGCFLGFFNGFGFLYVYSFGPLLSIELLSFSLMVPLVLFIVVFGLFVPESPYYFISKGRFEAAELSLKKLRCKDETSVLKELESMKELQEGTNSSLLDSFRLESFKKGLTITATLILFQQFVGITFIQSYLVLIFEASGSSISSSISAVIVAVIQVIGVVVSACLVDKWGRKKLLIYSTVLCGASLFFLGLYFYLKNIQDVQSLWWLPLSSLGVYIITYCAGIGTIPWALVGELFSSETKSVASSITAIVNFILAFVVTLVVPMFKELLGFEGVFWFFSISAIVCVLFVFLYVPETKGKTFQEILVILGDK